MTSNPKRLSIPTVQRSQEPSPASEERRHSVERRNSIDVQASNFADNCEKLANRHKTDKIKVIIDTIIKVLEVLKK